MKNHGVIFLKLPWLDIQGPPPPEAEANKDPENITKTTFLGVFDVGIVWYLFKQTGSAGPISGIFFSPEI